MFFLIKSDPYYRGGGIGIGTAKKLAALGLVMMCLYLMFMGQIRKTAATAVEAGRMKNVGCSGFLQGFRLIWFGQQRHCSLLAVLVRGVV